MARKKAQPEEPLAALPRLDSLRPEYALPGAQFELLGANLGPAPNALPQLLVDGLSAHITLCRPTRIAALVPEEAASGHVELVSEAGQGNALQLHIARKLADGLHPVTNPAVSRSGMVYATISGQRGRPTPVSVVRISHDGRATPFVTDLMNATGLAFSPAGDLFVTSRAEGNIYQVDATGEYNLYAEGMGVATGAAFDDEGNLYVGDRSGTIFKIDPERRIFVHATLEPSVSAYHLAMGPEGTLFVTGPSLSSNDAVWTIDRFGQSSLWFRGLGRPQGLALDHAGNLYLAACLRGRRGLVRLTPQKEAELLVAANDLVGLAFSPLGSTILATTSAVYELDLDLEQYA